MKVFFFILFALLRNKFLQIDSSSLVFIISHPFTLQKTLVETFFLYKTHILSSLILFNLSFAL